MSLDRIFSNFTFVIVIGVDVNRGSTFSFKRSLGSVYQNHFLIRSFFPLNVKVI